MSMSSVCCVRDTSKHPHATEYVFVLHRCVELEADDEEEEEDDEDVISFYR